MRCTFPVCDTTLTRRQAHERLNKIRELRNRIAHHEPIFNKNLDCCHETILEVTNWTSPGPAEWIRTYSQVGELLSSKDTDQAIKFQRKIDVRFLVRRQQHESHGLSRQECMLCRPTHAARDLLRKALSIAPECALVAPDSNSRGSSIMQLSSRTETLSNLAPAVD